MSLYFFIFYAVKYLQLKKYEHFKNTRAYIVVLQLHLYAYVQNNVKNSNVTSKSNGIGTHGDRCWPLRIRDHHRVWSSWDLAWATSNSWITSIMLLVGVDIEAVEFVNTNDMSLGRPNTNDSALEEFGMNDPAQTPQISSTSNIQT